MEDVDRRDVITHLLQFHLNNINNGSKMLGEIVWRLAQGSLRKGVEVSANAETFTKYELYCVCKGSNTVVEVLLRRGQPSPSFRLPDPLLTSEGRHVENTMLQLPSSKIVVRRSQR